MRRRTFLCASFGLGIAGGLAAPAAHAARQGGDAATAPARLPAHHGAAVAFGTTVSIQVLHVDADEASRAINAALHEVKRVDALMSLFRPDSQLATLNREGVLKHPHAHVQTVLAESQRLARLTGGAFDATVQPLWALHAQAARNGTAATQDAIRATGRLVDWRLVKMEPDAIRLSKPGMGLTFNGIAQGYASDLALAALKARGIRHALLDTGEFSSLGRAEDARPWTLGIRHPRDAASMTATVALDGRCVATSGDYESHFSKDYSRHHILDPKTGRSPLELASVSVVAPSAMLADGLSTACFVLGPERAIALCRQLPDTDAILIGKSGRTWKTPGIAALEALAARG